MVIYWTWTLLVAILSLLYYYDKKRLNYFKDLGIPYVPGYPIFGSMGSVFFSKKHINDLVKDLYSSHPDAKYVGFFDFGPRPIILIRDLELIKAITITHADKFPDHLAFVDESIDPLFGGDLFNVQGDRWKELKNILSPAFTSSKLKLMFPLITECAQNLIKYVESMPVESRKIVDIKEMFAKSLNDIIATCAFGINVDSLKNPNNDFYVFGRKITNFDGLAGLKIYLMRSFPALVKFLRLQFVDKDVSKFFRNIISTTVKTRDTEGIIRPDMLHLMMEARHTNSNSVKIDLEAIACQAFTFFFGGFYTSATHACFMAHELAINPDMQNQLQEEIDSVLRKNNGILTYEMIDNEMPYLNAIFQETLRRHTQAVMLVDRVCRTNFELPPASPGMKSITVPPGTNVMIPTVAIHNDSKYYKDPETFDPLRYYKKKISINDVLNLGFGIGPRACIGMRFAQIEVKILIFYLFSKFTLIRTEKTCSPLKYDKNSMFLALEGGFFLGIEPRNNNQ